ncbi:ECF transporter S component [Candidatus Chloroploca sp. Khr17]|uniref:ECF transporter S component n=1 Tax=Candidatus Chloroploca sp. Khr17 TaxID=2496869 RepID=UPI00101C4E0E|nr:ECF transporter S component [Candidatus Chloroploca sp. Khr17]
MDRPATQPGWGFLVRMALLGAVLYAATSWVTVFATTSSSAIAGNLRPGVAIPIFFGFAFGPLVGFVVGFGGNLLADMLTGFVHFPLDASSPQALAASLQINWQVANGLLGLIPGFAVLRQWCYQTREGLLKALGLTSLAVVAAGLFAAVLDPFVFVYEDQTTIWQTVARNNLPLVLINWIYAAVIVPILLFNYAYRHLYGPAMFRAGLMQRVLLTVVISAAVPIIMLSLFLLEANARLNGGWAGAFGGVFFQLAVTILMTTVFIITNAALMAQSMTRPLIDLSEAARAMEKNTLTVAQAETLKAATGDDEIAQLSRVFGTMAQEVIQREQDLRKHVQDLQIMIDEHKRSDQVKEIVETDFFRDLKQKAREMRERGKAQPASTNE